MKRLVFFFSRDLRRHAPEELKLPVSLVTLPAVQRNRIVSLKTPPQGIALAQTIDDVLSKLVNPSQEMGLSIGDLNGDNHRAMDWGYTLVRLQNKYRLGDLPNGYQH